MKASPLTWLREYLRTNKERVILYGVFLLFCIFVGGGFFLQHNRKQGKELAKDAKPKVVELQLQQKKGDAVQGGGTAESAPYFLEPSPGELLQQLTSLENLNEEVIEGKYLGLRVLWPAYFFALEDGQGGKGTLVLDVDEDGFGVVIESEVDLSAHPQVKTLQVGKKMWIGGEIKMIDRTGTGTVILNAESFFLDGDPVLSRPKNAKQK